MVSAYQCVLMRIDCLASAPEERKTAKFVEAAVIHFMDTLRINDRPRARVCSSADGNIGAQNSS